MVSKKKSDELEGEEGLNSSVGEIYPDAVVRISKEQYSIFEIKRMIQGIKDIIIDPEFQRNNVWKLDQERELIESILMGIPIPVFYFFEDKKGNKQVVDGRQRLSAMVRFLDNRFSLNNLKMLPGFNGKKFAELDPVYQSKIERYQIFVYLIEPPTPERVKYDIFDRVNRGGTTLNNQEMRNAIYIGKSTALLKNLSESEIFKKATGKGIKAKRMKDQYIILRFFAFYLWKKKRLKSEYKSNIDDFLAEAMQHINGLTEPEILELESVFIDSMEKAYQILGEDAFRFNAHDTKKRPINMPLFEALTYFFASSDFTHLSNDMLKDRLDTLKEEFDKSGNFRSNVGSSSNVDDRFGKVEKLIGDIGCSK